MRTPHARYLLADKFIWTLWVEGVSHLQLKFSMALFTRCCQAYYIVKRFM